MKIAISACLLGENVRFDGTNKKNEELIKLLEKHDTVSICPEISSGFSIPHDPIEIKNNKAFTIKGIDVTEQLNKGCDKTLKMIEDCKIVILKSKSPSCGYEQIYDGSFADKLIEGNGMFASKCINKKIKIFTENDLDLLKEILLNE